MVVPEPEQADALLYLSVTGYSCVFGKRNYRVLESLCVCVCVCFCTITQKEIDL